MEIKKFLIGFSESEYLTLYPDVAAAVKAGTFKSGYEHYEKHGKSEGRQPNGLSPREHAVFHLIDKQGFGLEIGPSHNPIAPKKKGYKVHILDHLSTNDLRIKYQDHGLNLDNIEEVDFIWSGQPLHEIIGKKHCYDWIIASHVIEHLPDLISFLQQSYPPHKYQELHLEALDDFLMKEKADVSLQLC